MPIRYFITSLHDLFNPLVPKAQNANGEFQNLLFPLQIKPVKVNLNFNWRIFIFFTFGNIGLSFRILIDN